MRITEKSQPWQVAYGSGSSHCAVCGNSSPQDVTTIRSLQDSRGDRTRNLLRVTNCTETCLVQEVSERETGTALWGNGVLFWALILDLPSNVILREWRTDRQNSSPSLRHKTSAAPGQFAHAGSCSHHHASEGLTHYFSLALFPHPAL